MIYKFLLGLNKELDEVRGRVFGTKSMPNLRQVFSKVRREESCRRVMLGTSASSTVEGSALATRFSSDPKPTGGPDLVFLKRRPADHGAITANGPVTRKILAGRSMANLRIGNQAQKGT